MKNIKVAVVFIAGISLQAHANNSVDITSSTPEGVHTKFESAHQVRDRMASSGFTLHRCGIQSIKKGHMADQDMETPHSQITCMYSKPGAQVTDESEIAYWHLNVVYDMSSQMYKAGIEFTDIYQTHIYTLTPSYLLDAAPNFHQQRASLQSSGKSVGECELQQIYYFMKPTEATYLSHVATCPVYAAEGELSGHLNVAIDYNSERKGYTEASVGFESL